MFKNVLLLSGVLLCMVSCYKFNVPEPPKNLIPKDKMVHILLDAKLMSNGITGHDRKVLDSAKVEALPFLYEKHGIDSAQFAQSNLYYTYHLEAYEAIYEQLKDTISKLKSHYQGILDEEQKAKKLKDSLEKAKKLKDTAKVKKPLTEKSISPKTSQLPKMP